MKRREFCKLLGVTSGALAAPWGMAEAQTKLLSHILPGDAPVPADQWVLHRTACTECPAGCGLLVKARAGHPVKLEGDPDHPVNQGGLCIRGQASLARLYHPERLKQPMLRGDDGELEPISWDEAFGWIQHAFGDSRASGTRHLYIAGRTTGSLGKLIDTFAAEREVEVLPEIELFDQGALRTAYEVLVGRREVPDFDTAAADLLVTVGADLLEGFGNPVQNARRFATATDRGAHWLHFEPHLSLTGCNAGERLEIRAGSEAWLLAYLVRAVRATRPLPPAIEQALPLVPVEVAAEHTGLETAALTRVVERIDRARQPLVIAGGVSTAHAGGLMAGLLAGLLQESLGAMGQLVDFDRAENYERVGTAGEVAGRIAALDGESVGVCFVSRTHTLDHIPGAAEVVAGAKLAVGLSDFLYPSVAHCGLILPLSHGLEGSGDAEPRRGLRNQLEPVFKPLFDTRTEGDILLALMGWSTTYADYLRNRRSRVNNADDSPAFVETPARLPRPELREGAIVQTLRRAKLGGALAEPALVVTPSARTFDGRSRVITLLHEIPDPLSAVSYGDFVNSGPDTAARHGLEDGSGVELVTTVGTARLPVRRHHAHPDGVFSLAIDHAGDLRLPIDPATGELVRCLGGVEMRRTSERHMMTMLAGSLDPEGRGILEPAHHGPGHGTVVGAAPGHDDTTAPGHDDAAAPADQRLYDPPEHDTYRWAMAIDLAKCTGCSACVAACYIENNVPVVGPEEHAKGREMSWIRVQPYVDESCPVEFVPMMCQHCDSAPCETVCPVYATYHNPEGLNAQVYNRCVGTRYCANNCPYKARRFNWFDHPRQAPADLMVNPDVSLRPRGVMEKCTFCIQRIRQAKDTAKDDDRLVRDGEFTTACGESCPTGAITFGNLLDKDSKVYKQSESPRAYRVFENLGTGPAVYYLRRENQDES